jgi:hypothetical protein
MDCEKIVTKAQKRMLAELLKMHVIQSTINAALIELLPQENAPEIIDKNSRLVEAIQSATSLLTEIWGDAE